MKSNTPLMRKLLKRGIRMAKKSSRPKPGYFNSLFHHEANGRHYQIEYQRYNEYSCAPGFEVVVYRFNDGKDCMARPADASLSGKVL